MPTQDPIDCYNLNLYLVIVLLSSIQCYLNHTRKLFDVDFNQALQSADDLLQEIESNHIIRGVICEMCFQLGKPRVMKFKKMWQALRDGDFQEASAQIIDSQWHKQTPGRCEEVAAEMAGSIL